MFCGYDMGSNSFSPDHRPGFAAGAVPPSPPPPASRTNGAPAFDVLVDQGDSGYYPANALPARRARWDAAQGS